MVVDDDPVNLDLMVYLLRAFSHTPLPADGGAPALEILRTARVDLILCDIQMPGIDGFSFLRHLDGMEGKPPVIGVTALAMVGDREKILSAGFDGYMTKPITPETFVPEVDRYLAVSQRAPHEPVRDSAPGAGTSPPASTPKNIRVLIADDHPANLQILRLLLEHWGYEVLSADSGHAALELARRERPHAIISDLHMPHGDAFELLESASRDPLLRDIPVIVVSATGERSPNAEKTLARGAARFLQQPFESEALRDALEQILAEVTR